MKQTILLFILISGFAFGQLKVDTINTGEFIGRYESSFIKKKNNEYTFCYRDYQYSTFNRLDCITFENKDNSFENFYKTIIDGIENPPKEGVMVTLGDSNFKMKFSRYSVTIYKYEYGVLTSYSGPINKKQVAKLFGKK